MNNDEKILEILTNMKTRFDKLETDIAELKEGQAAIAKDVKAIAEQTQDLVEFQAETKINFQKLSGKLDSVVRVSTTNSYDIADLKANVREIKNVSSFDE